jgi:hypothetical protein
MLKAKTVDLADSNVAHLGGKVGSVNFSTLNIYFLVYSTFLLL